MQAGPMYKNLHKEFCEIESCDVTDPSQLQNHNIVERTEINKSNNYYNLTVLCSNHHNLLHHTDRLKIIGVYPSTAKNGRMLVYELDGKKNIDIDEPYFKYQTKQTKVYYGKKYKNE